MIPVQIAGLSGYKILYMKADLHLPVHTAGGIAHTIIIQDVFYDPDGHFNLVSSDQLNATNYDVMLTANPAYSCLHFIDEHTGAKPQFIKGKTWWSTANSLSGANKESLSGSESHTDGNAG
mmetsp:Transcript_62377/g.129465  ORF Transcript_62377/g.129465 Transcript_62377/m.129465 type:complete len:121 (-) Transcript_62377:204-566(-)